MLISKKKGLCIVNFPMQISPLWLSTWQENFLGSILFEKNPNFSPYAKISIKKDSIYFADSCKAQPLHTDEGYTTSIPHYISLYCEYASSRGGVSTIVLVDDVLKHILPQHLEAYTKGFIKNAMRVESAHGTFYKPLFFNYESNKIGIAYSPIVKNIYTSSGLQNLYEAITEYSHKPENQFRIKLEKGDLLLLDNLRVLHGRTAFEENSKRIFYRYWFSKKYIG